MDSVDSSCHLYKRLPVRHAMLPVRASTVCSPHTCFNQTRGLIIEKCPNCLSYFNLGSRRRNISQALSLGLLLSIHHKTKRFSFLCPSIKCGLLHYNDVIYFISYNDALLVAFNKPKHNRNRVPLPEIIIVVSGDYFLCGAPHQITAQIGVGLIFSSGLSCLRRVHFSSRRIRLK